MPVLNPIKFKVIPHEDDEYYNFQFWINAPVAHLEAAPKERSFWGGVKQPDPPAILVERRVEVIFTFYFAFGVIERHIAPIELDPPSGFRQLIHNSNTDINPEIPLGALSLFEIANGDEWDGLPPLSTRWVKHPRSGQICETATPLWDLAAINQTNGERVLATRTNAKKQELTKVVFQLNQIVAYSHAVAEAFPDLTTEPPDELRDEVDAWCLENPMKFSL